MLLKIGGWNFIFCCFFKNFFSTLFVFSLSKSVMDISDFAVNPVWRLSRFATKNREKIIICNKKKKKMILMCSRVVKCKTLCSVKANILKMAFITFCIRALHTNLATYFVIIINIIVFTCHVIFHIPTYYKKIKTISIRTHRYTNTILLHRTFWVW